MTGTRYPPFIPVLCLILLSKLQLKLGVPVMVLCNLDPANGLCNGTQGVVIKMSQHMIEIQITSGNFRGNTAFIPCIILDSTDGDFPFKLRHCQFPFQLAFATMEWGGNGSQQGDGLGSLYDALAISGKSVYAMCMLRGSSPTTPTTINKLQGQSLTYTGLDLRIVASPFGPLGHVTNRLCHRSQ